MDQRDGDDEDEMRAGRDEAGQEVPAARDATGDVAALSLLEEDVRVGKRSVVTGKVRVRTVVDIHEELVRQELDAGHVTVTRVPIDRIVDAAPLIRTEGDVTIIPVLEEVIVIEKKLVLREEVHLRRTVTTEVVEERVPLRKQSAVIEQIDALRSRCEEE